MRRPIAFVVTFLLGFCAGIMLPRLKPAPTESAILSNGHWQNRSSFFATSKARARIVMAGDSLTEEGEWAELLPGVPVLDRGISFDTTFGLNARLDSIIQAHPEKVFVMIGINDFLAGRSVDLVFANYQKILARLKAAGIQPVIESTLYVSKGYKGSAGINAKVRALNEKLAATGAPFIDLNAVLAPSGVLDESLTHDGLHMDGEAYRRWAVAVQRHLQGLDVGAQ